MEKTAVRSQQSHWEKLVGILEGAGADLIELSMSCPQGEQSIAGTSETVAQRIPASDPERMYETTKIVTSAVAHATPVIVKMTPNVTDIAQLAAAAKLNTDGLGTWGGLSGPLLKPVALAAVTKILTTVPELPVSGVGGITTWSDAVEFLLLGAAPLQICTAISMYGRTMVQPLCRKLSEYMECKGFSSIAQMQGQSLKYLVEHSKLRRDVHTVCQIDGDLCIGCGKCVICCNDYAFGALRQTAVGAKPVVNAAVCRGCGACSSVCAKNAIRYVDQGAVKE
jgi:dihydropyrimidine dehydrogenase (NAD+) subunit PreA